MHPPRPTYGPCLKPASRNPAWRTTRITPGTETSAREQLGDFYLYPLAGRTTIADKQTKQVSFLDAKGVAASSGYRFENAFRTGQKKHKAFNPATPISGVST